MRTNHPVERANRQVRFDEKVRYRRRSLDRFLHLRRGGLGRQAGIATPPAADAEPGPESAPKGGGTSGGD